MRIRTLEIEGFGPYREQQTIDFGPFERAGLFAITGRTGAGKSSVLDAILFALFDAVPRYENTERSVRSDFSAPTDPTRVRLEFEVRGTTYRVTRTPTYRRPKQRGSGETVEKATALLEQWEPDQALVEGGAWRTLEVMPRDVGPRVSEILGLTAVQFRQVILLAQGRFAEFLHADTKQRREVLRTLFDTARYENLERQLRELARETDRELDGVDRLLTDLLGQAAGTVDAEVPGPGEEEEWFAAHASGLATREREARAAAEVADEVARLAGAALETARRQEEARLRRDGAAAALAALEARTQEVEELRQALRRARRAAPIVAAHNAVERAERAATSAREKAAAAAAALRDLDGAHVLPAELHRSWEATSSAAQPEVAPLRELASALATESGRLAQALRSEQQLPALERDLGAANADVDRARQHQAQIAERIASTPAGIARLEELLTAQEELAATLEQRLEEHTGALALVAAHEEVARLERELHDLRQREAERSGAALLAHSRHDAALRGRLRHSAALLSRDLVDGAPCPVCGSLEHPEPAAEPPDAVSDAEVEAAALAARTAQADLGAASQAAAAAQAALVDAHRRAEGSAADAADRLRRASGAVEEARAAGRSLVTTRGELDGLRTSLAADRAAVAELEVDLSRLDAARAAAAERVEHARAVVDQARGAAQTVAALAAVVQAAQAAVGSLADACEGTAAGARELEQRRAELTEVVATSGFDSAEEGLAAALDPGTVANLEVQVSEFDQALAAAKGSLAQAGAVEIPEEVADLPVLETRQREAAEGRADALRAATLAEAGRTHFDRLRADHARAGRDSRPLRERAELLRSLAATVEGGGGGNTRRIRFESFVLAARLESIVAAANRRLLTMTSGQYALEVDDGHQYRNAEAGLGLRVSDAHTGQSRSTASLSGGETFLASLALALGLAETVAAEAGGIQLDTLFIDEGFGALDEDTLEIAMATLEDLRSGGRVVGLISHVEAMKDDIPAQLRVARLPDRSSRVEVVVAG